MSSIRLSFRLAWRAAKRERLGTFLTALLVALPVVALVTAGILATSSKVSDRLDAQRRYGRADVAITRTDYTYAPSDANHDVAGPGPLPAGPLTALPAGSRLITETIRSSDILTTSGGGFSSIVNPYELDAADPIAKGILVFRTGRYPTRPGEIALTTYLAHRLGVQVGDTVHLKSLGTERVVATIDDPTYLHAREIYSVEGAFAALPAQYITYLATLPAGTDATHLALPAGFSATATATTSSGAQLPDGDTLNTGALILVLALLEASLTAGTAFAVGARRRRRDLALVAVNGGRPSHTAGVVLANGIVCGVVGIIVGLGVGVGAARLSYPLLQHHASELLPGLRVSPLVLLAAAAFGLVSALISSALPAFLAAKGSLRNALGRSRGSSGTPGWITAAGAGVFALGVAVVSAAVKDASSGNGQQTTTALIGVVFVELGGVAVCPALLGFAGRFGSRLPALPRLALRDAARQRARSGPAVAAIAAAVSGAMALSIYFASDHLEQVRDYQSLVPRNVVSVSQLNNDGSAVTTAQLASAIGVEAASRSARSSDLLGTVTPLSIVYADHPDDAALSENSSGNILVAGSDLLKLLGATPQAQQALDRGEVVVGGTLPTPPSIRFSNLNGQRSVLSDPFASISAGWSEPQAHPLAVMSRATADRVVASLPKAAAAANRSGTGFDAQLWAPLPAQLSNSARSDLRNRAADVGISLIIDSGPGDTDTLVTLALLGVAAVFALIVTAAATVLAAAESQSDLSILGAVGATSLTRRLFTAAQGSTTAFLGGALGILIGLVPGIAVVQSNHRLPLTVPWQPFAAFLIGLPLLAALGGVLFSRSRLPGVTRTL